MRRRLQFPFPRTSITIPSPRLYRPGTVTGDLPAILIFPVTALATAISALFAYEGNLQQI